MRVLFITLLLVTAPQPLWAEEHQPKFHPDQLRAARLSAEAHVKPSGPLRSGRAEPFIARAWEPNRQLVGTYRDPQSRYRHVPQTAPWFWPYGVYGYRVFGHFPVPVRGYGCH